MNGRSRRVLFGTTLAVGVIFAQLPATMAGAAASTQVNFELYYDAPVIAAGGTGQISLTVANSGADATGPATLTMAAPEFVGIDPAQPLPPECHLLFSAGAGAGEIPDVLRCALPKLPHGYSEGVTIPVTVAAEAAGTTLGEAMVTPAAGSADLQQNPTTGIGWPSVTVSGGGGAAHPPGPGHVTDLYLTADLPAIATGRPGVETFTVGNLGPEVTTGPVLLVFTTPPLIRVDPAQPLPAGCDFAYQGQDPTAPQILRCVLTDPVPANTQRRLAVPLSVLFGAPVQTSWGISGVFPDQADGSTDIDPVPANNVVEPGAQVVG